MIKRITYTAITILWMIIIFMMSSQTAEISGGQSSDIAEKILGIFWSNPSADLVDTFETIIRKLCHFFEYAILCFLCYNTLSSYNVKKRNLIYSVVISVVFAISDEFHQYFVPGRACRVIDILIDTSGTVLSYLTLKLFSEKK